MKHTNGANVQASLISLPIIALGQLAKSYLVSRATIHRVLKVHAEASLGPVSKGLEKSA
jgi:hypothetical protein